MNGYSSRDQDVAEILANIRDHRLPTHHARATHHRRSPARPTGIRAAAAARAAQPDDESDPDLEIDFVPSAPSQQEAQHKKQPQQERSASYRNGRRPPDDQETEEGDEEEEEEEGGADGQDEANGLHMNLRSSNKRKVPPASDAAAAEAIDTEVPSNTHHNNTTTTTATVKAGDLANGNSSRNSIVKKQWESSALALRQSARILDHWKLESLDEILPDLHPEHWGEHLIRHIWRLARNGYPLLLVRTKLREAVKERLAGEKDFQGYGASNSASRPFLTRPDAEKVWIKLSTDNTIRTEKLEHRPTPKRPVPQKRKQAPAADRQSTSDAAVRARSPSPALLPEITVRDAFSATAAKTPVPLDDASPSFTPVPTKPHVERSAKRRFTTLEAELTSDLESLQLDLRVATAEYDRLKHLLGTAEATLQGKKAVIDERYTELAKRKELVARVVMDHAAALSDLTRFRELYHGLLHAEALDDEGVLEKSVGSATSNGSTPTPANNGSRRDSQAFQQNGGKDGSPLSPPAASAFSHLVEALESQKQHFETAGLVTLKQREAELAESLAQLEHDTKLGELRAALQEKHAVLEGLKKEETDLMEGLHDLKHLKRMRTGD
ncbi:hypothetical protein NKR23_g5611 [Pleurostoma richardsiae]|uniref:Uncharacterized protein n=1 Tax=Pleurostoma richardsiae TaxID=41990 RepID=A0AA38VTQ2_9PEZI|nr:hypothetical protein NKR23_g5611 [Pleurostoma richardsiae]